MSVTVIMFQYAHLAKTIRVPGGEKKKEAPSEQEGIEKQTAEEEEEEDFEGGIC